MNTIIYPGKLFSISNKSTIWIFVHEARHPIFYSLHSRNTPNRKYKHAIAAATIN